MWVIGAVALGLVLLVVDRLTAAGVFDRHRHPRRKRAGGAPLGSAMGTLLDFYDPGHRHVSEEEQRQRSWTEQSPDSAPPLDLDSGVVELDQRDGPDPSR